MDDDGGGSILVPHMNNKAKKYISNFNTSIRIKSE